jgi:hypothetical protein
MRSPKSLKSFLLKRFGEPISDLVCYGRWAVLRLHRSTVLFISLPLALDFRMLRAAMVLRVQEQSDGSLDVTTNDRCGFSLAHVDSLRRVLSQIASLLVSGLEIQLHRSRGQRRFGASITS